MILTLFFEKQYDDMPYVVGCCPERKNTYSVHVDNLVEPRDEQ